MEDSDISLTQMFNESPVIVPSTPISSLGGRALNDKEKRDLTRFVQQNQGVYELALFNSGDVVPTDYVLNGIPHNTDDITDKPSSEHEQPVWLNGDCLILYLAWEQCWYRRNSEGEALPIRAIDLYKIVHHEYCGLDRTGLIKQSYLEAERKWMRKEDEESEEKEDEEDKMDNLTELGLPEINKEPRDIPYTMKELEQRKSNRGNIRNYWWKRNNEDENVDSINVPKGAKACFTMKFPEFMNKLREFEMMGYMTIRPLVSPTKDLQLTSSSYKHPHCHLSIFFSTEKGLELWRSFLNNSSSIPGVMLRYHKQRQKRYLYLSEAELIDGEIYKGISNQAGDPHESGMDSLMRRKKRKKV